MESIGGNINQNCVIRNCDIALCFDGGKLSLHYKDKELTKNVGFNAAIFSGGLWHDSNEAEFTINKQTADKIMITNKWRTLPVTQIWSFCISGRKIKWDIDLDIEKHLVINKKSVSIFLSEDYLNWFSPFKEGRFPSEFRVWEDMFSLWEDLFIFTQDKATKLIGVKAEEGRPAIIFDLSGEQEYTPKIQNTHHGLCSRILKAESEDQESDYQPGRYRFFSGSVNIIENNSEINEIINVCPKRVEIDGYTRDTEPVIAENGYLSPDAIYIYGDSAELHDRISSVPGNFQEVIAQARNALGAGKQIRIKVVISRFNFFRLNKIIEFCSVLLGARLDARVISLNIFPARKLYDNFVEYLRELRVKIHSSNMQLVFKDEELLDILKTISLQATQDNGKDLLRLLGVITEHAFIGPQTAVIDSYHRCNTNCLHCWVHSPRKNPDEEFLNTQMDMELYTRLINDASELLVDEIIFAGDGEPLLNEKFLGMVRHARNKGIKVLFFTNGILLNSDIAKDVIDLEVTQIFCSLPAGTAKNYALINPGHPEQVFYSIVDNLKRLISLRNQAGKKRPVLLMTHVIHNLNYKELMEMAKIDVEIGADIVRFYLVRLDSDIEFLRLNAEESEDLKKSLKGVKAYLADKNIELQDNIDFQLAHYNEASGAWSQGVFLNGGCPVGWFFCLVPADGEMSYCCHLKTTGFLNKSSFKQIWESEEYRLYRIKAKYLNDNKGSLFANGARLYNEHCGHCDTHQVILRINEMLQLYGLKKFVFFSNKNL